MSGENIVFFPKFTTLAGAGTFISDPYDIAAYKSIVIETLLVAANGSPTTVEVVVEKGSDLEKWTTADTDALTAGTSNFSTLPDMVRYVRVKIVVTGGTNPSVTVWSKGVARDA